MQAAWQPTGSEKLFPEEAGTGRQASKQAREESFSRAKVEKNGRLVFVFAAVAVAVGGRGAGGRAGGGAGGGILTKKQALSFRSNLLCSLGQMPLPVHTTRASQGLSAGRARQYRLLHVDQVSPGFGSFRRHSVSTGDHAPQYYSFHAPTLLSFMNSSGGPRRAGGGG